MTSATKTYDLATCSRAREDFPALKREVDGMKIAYLDGPAGTQVPRTVIDAISNYYARNNANTDGRFATSVDSDRMLKEARESAASLLGAPSYREISFGANMTTLTFSLSQGLVRSMKPGDEIVITELDHEANRGPWLKLRERGIEVQEVRVRDDATLDEQDLARKIGPKTRLVAVGYSSNAFGTANNLELARELSKKVGAYFLIDAVHGAPHFPIDVDALDADFLLCSAYKFYGPHVGILYCRRGLLESLELDRLRTQYAKAPHRIETGTLNHAAIAGVGAAIDYIASWGEGDDLRTQLVSAVGSIGHYEHSLAENYYDRVQSIPKVRTWGPGFEQKRAPTVAVTVGSMNPTEVARRLGARGVAVWDGDFYAVRPMERLGLVERGGVMRTGISMYNTLDEVDRLIDGLKEMAREA